MLKHGLALIKPSVEELRELIGANQLVSKQRTTFSLLPEGLLVGSITEVTGPGKTELVAQFLKENDSFKVAWIENTISINPYGLFQKGVCLENTLFIEAGEEFLWCVTQAMQSGCFQVLVTYGKSFAEKELRRIQLLSEKNESHFFLLSDSFHKSWVPHLQLEVSKKKKGLNIKTLRKRGHG